MSELDESTEELKEKLISLEIAVEELISEKDNSGGVFNGALEVIETQSGTRQTIVHFIDVAEYEFSPPSTKSLAHAAFTKIIETEWDGEKRIKDRLITHGDLVVIKGDPCLYYCYIALIDRSSDSPSGFQKEAPFEGPITNYNKADVPRLELIIWSEVYPGGGANVEVEFSKITLTPGTQSESKITELNIIPDELVPDPITLNIPELTIDPKDEEDPIPLVVPTEISFEEAGGASTGDECTFNTSKIVTEVDPDGVEDHFYIKTFKITPETIDGDDVDFTVFTLSTDTKVLPNLKKEFNTTGLAFNQPKGKADDALTFFTAKPYVTEEEKEPDLSSTIDYSNSRWTFEDSDSDADNFKVNEFSIDDSASEELEATLENNILNITDETPDDADSDTVEFFDSSHRWIGLETDDDYFFGAPSAGAAVPGISTPQWQPNVDYNAGDVVQHNGAVFKADNGHLSNANEPPGGGADSFTEQEDKDPDKIYLATDLNIDVGCADQYAENEKIEVTNITDLSFKKGDLVPVDNFTILTGIEEVNVTPGSPDDKSNEDVSQVTAISIATGTKTVLNTDTVLQSLDGAFIDPKAIVKGTPFNVLTSVGESEVTNTDAGNGLIFTEAASSSCSNCLVVTPKKLQLKTLSQKFVSKEITPKTQDHDFYVKSTPVKITTYEHDNTLKLEQLKKNIKVSEVTNQMALIANVETLKVQKIAIDLKVDAVKHEIEEQLRKFSFDASWSEIPASINSTEFEFTKKKLNIKRREGELYGDKKTATIDQYIYKFAQEKRIDKIYSTKIVVTLNNHKTVYIDPWVLYLKQLEQGQVEFQPVSQTLSFSDTQKAKLSPKVTTLTKQDKKVTLSTEEHTFDFENVYDLNIKGEKTTLKYEDAVQARISPRHIKITFSDEKEITLTPKEFKFVMEQKAKKLTPREVELIYKNAKQYKAIPKNYTLKQFKKTIKYKPVTVKTEDGGLKITADECQTVNGSGGMSGGTTENMGSVTITPDPPIDDIPLNTVKLEEIPIEGDPEEEPDPLTLNSLKIEDDPDNDPKKVDESIFSVDVSCEDGVEIKDLDFKTSEIEKIPLDLPDSPEIHSSKFTKTSGSIPSVKIKASNYVVKDEDENPVPISIQELGLTKNGDYTNGDGIRNLNTNGYEITTDYEFQPDDTFEDDQESETTVPGSDIYALETTDDDGEPIPEKNIDLYKIRYEKGDEPLPDADPVIPDKLVHGTSITVDT